MNFLRVLRPGMCYKLVAWSCPTLCNSMDCNPPGSSVHGILQATVLEWVAISFSRGSSQPRGRTPIPCIADRFFTIWATGEALRPGAWSQLRLWVQVPVWVLAGSGSQPMDSSPIWGAQFQLHSDTWAFWLVHTHQAHTNLKVLVMPGMPSSPLELCPNVTSEVLLNNPHLTTYTHLLSPSPQPCFLTIALPHMLRY